jgi:hypothetical protein
MSKSLEMEALEIFEDSIISTKHKNAYEILEKAVKRQEPLYSYNNGDNIDRQPSMYTTVYNCDNCLKYVDIGDIYCKHCGQKL